MASGFYLSLPDELNSFVEENCGEGSQYARPSDFVEDLLRQCKLRAEATAVRDAVLDGYQDVIHGRVVTYDGDLRRLLKESDR